MGERTTLLRPHRRRRTARRGLLRPRQRSGLHPRLGGRQRRFGHPRLVARARSPRERTRRRVLPGDLERQRHAPQQRLDLVPGLERMAAPNGDDPIAGQRLLRGHLRPSGRRAPHELWEGVVPARLDGGGGAFLYQPTDRQDPWNGAWTRDLGKPEAPKRRVGVAWLRKYSDGIV